MTVRVAYVCQSLDMYWTAFVPVKACVPLGQYQNIHSPVVHMQMISTTITDVVPAQQWATQRRQWLRRRGG